MTTRSNQPSVRKPFKVGDQVTFPRGDRAAEAVIVEDFGPLGVGGRRIYGILYHNYPNEEPVYGALAENYLTPIDGADATPPAKGSSSKPKDSP